MSEGVGCDFFYYPGFERVFFYNFLDANCGESAFFIVEDVFFFLAFAAIYEKGFVIVVSSFNI